VKIIITGSTGFIGTNFIKSATDLNIIEIDLLTQTVNEIDFVGIDTVLHLAAIVHQMKGAQQDQYFKINRDLAFSVAKEAKSKGVKHFVFMSTAKVYGESTTNKKPWNINSECSPQDAYGRSKFEAEKLICGLEDNNFKVAVIRSPMVYGAGVKANMFKLMRLVDRCPVLPLGDIQNRRSIVFVGNLIALIKQIIIKQASGIFIAGDIAPLSTTQLTNLIAESLQKKIKLIKIPGFIVSGIGIIIPSIIDRLFGSLELDNQYTNYKLQFTPPFSSAEGISEMVTWYIARFKNYKLIN
jgi:nucleoside-diphosphate-sugar epimerase